MKRICVKITFAFALFAVYRGDMGKDASVQNIKKERKIKDDLTLLEHLIAIFDTKSHKQVAAFSVLLGKHILEVANIQPSAEVLQSFVINERWQVGQAKVQEARQVAFALHKLARAESDLKKIQVFRMLGHIAATPHVKRHAIVATNYAIKVINLIYDSNISEITKEREYQILLMQKL